MEATERIEVTGTRLAACRRGEGAPVLFVHGSASDMRSWEAQLDAVAKTRTAVAYSRRYHRPNPEIAPGADYAMEEQVADLTEVIGTFDRPVALVGHSYGGVLSLLAAERTPDRIGALVLEEPPVFTLFVSDPPRPQQILWLLLRHPLIAVALIRFAATAVAPATAAAKRGDRNAMVAALARGILGPRAYDALSPARLEQARENSAPEELLGSGFLRLEARALGKIRCPVLIVTGRQSPALWRRLARWLARVIPQARLVAVDGASHIVHEDAPGAYNALLTDFLSAQGRIS